MEPSISPGSFNATGCSAPAVASGGMHAPSALTEDHTALLRNLSVAVAALQNSHSTISESFVRRSRLSEYFLVFLVCLVLAAVVLYRMREILAREIIRRNQGQAIASLKDVDEATIRKVLGETNMPAWMGFPDYERVKWINTVIGQLWPHFSNAVSTLARQQLGPLLAETKPPWISSITLKTLTLGDVPPQVNGVKVYQQEGAAREVMMELDFLWSGKQDISLMVHPIPKGESAPAIVKEAATIASNFIVLKAGVDDLIISGRMRLTLAPLVEYLPCITAMQICMVEQPKFTFNLRVYGGNVSFVPGLEAFLTSFIRDNVLRPYVLPERLLVPLLPADMEELEKPTGLLHVKIIEAEAVRKPLTDLFGECHPYVRLFLRDSRKSKTQPQDGKGHPVWNETFRLLVHEREHEKLTLIICDHNHIEKDVEIGRAVLPLTALQDGKPQDLWLDIGKASQNHRSLKHLRPHGTAAHTAEQQGEHPKQKALKPLKKGLDLVMRQPHGQCRIHIQATYVEFSEEEVDVAMEHQEHPGTTGREARAMEADKNLREVLRGGVLVVHIKAARNLVKPDSKRVTSATAVVELAVGGQKKSTTTVSSRKDLLFNQDLEFALEADAAENKDERILVTVSARHWFHHYKGTAVVMLRDVMAARQVKTSLPLEGMQQGEVDLELRWFTAMEGA